MNLNVFSAGLAVLLTGVVAVQGVQLHATRAQLDALSQSLHPIQSQQEEDVTFEPATRAPDHSGAEGIDVQQKSKAQALESRVAALEQSLRVQESNRPGKQLE